jgi:hypothetical protein
MAPRPQDLLQGAFVDGIAEDGCVSDQLHVFTSFDVMWMDWSGDEDPPPAGGVSGLRGRLPEPP